MNWLNTEKTGIIFVMEDSHNSRLAAINLRERLNALSELYTSKSQ
ncbi:MAG: hypothetical protein WED07_14050 [Candidatus Freyarchaeum deiterrae]